MSTRFWKSALKGFDNFEKVIGGHFLPEVSYEGGGTPSPLPPLSLVGLETVAVLAYSTITNTGTTTLNGDVDLSPGTSITGFGPPSSITGNFNAANSTAAAARVVAQTDFNVGNALMGATVISGNLGGQTLTPGLYNSASSIGVTGTLTLNGEGNPNAVFIFQIGSTLNLATGATIVLENGATAANVFWLVGSSATFNTTATMIGQVFAYASITMNTGATIDGRLLALNGAVTFDANTNSPLTTPAVGTFSTAVVNSPGSSAWTVARIGVGRFLVTTRGNSGFIKGIRASLLIDPASANTNLAVTVGPVTVVDGNVCFELDVQDTITGALTDIGQPASPAANGSAVMWHMRTSNIRFLPRRA
jgi:hypothetical protein